MITLGVPNSELSIASDEIVRFPMVNIYYTHGVLSFCREYAHGRT